MLSLVLVIEDCIVQQYSRRFRPAWNNSWCCKSWEKKLNKIYYIYLDTRVSNGSQGGTVRSNGFYADIWSQHQMQQYQLCLKSFLSNFGSSEVP